MDGVERQRTREGWGGRKIDLIPLSPNLQPPAISALGSLVLTGSLRMAFHLDLQPSAIPFLPPSRSSADTPQCQDVTPPFSRQILDSPL